MRRRPPRSTLFPTRRSSDLMVTGIGDVKPAVEAEGHRRLGVLAIGRKGELAVSSSSTAPAVDQLAFRSKDLERSEEHTSELQSRQYIVCRLLLEKKTQTILY